MLIRHILYNLIIPRVSKDKQVDPIFQSATSILVGLCQTSGEGRKRVLTEVANLIRNITPQAASNGKLGP